MPIADKKVKPGMVLVARYKGKEHRAEVVKTKDGIRFKLKDGREFKSPSSAGVAVKGGDKTCDGWEFWSVEGAPPVPRRAQREGQASGKAARPARKAKSARKAATRAKRRPTTKRATKPKSGATSATRPKPGNPSPDAAKEQAPKPVSCGECGAEFPDAAQASAHMRDAHNSPEAAPGDR